MDELLKQVGGYGPAGAAIALLLYALRWLFLRYDKAMQDQIELGRSAIQANLATAAALDKVAGMQERHEAQLGALKAAIDGWRRE